VVKDRLTEGTPTATALDELPFTPEGRADIGRLFSETDFLPGRTTAQRLELLRRTSYEGLPAQDGRRRRRDGHAAEEHSESVLGAQLRRAVGARRIPARPAGLHRSAVRRGRRSVPGRRAVHLSFPGRQRERRATAGAQTDSRHCTGHHDGRHRDGALRLRASR
jgi:hypothetical protein